MVWTELSKHGAKITWDDVCTPLKGGIGIKNIVVWNKASMARQKDSL